MKRSGSKPGIQRRRSSGILKLGRLHLRDVPTPAKNAVFSFTGADGGGTKNSTDHASTSIAASFRLTPGTALPTANAKNEPIPLPSSHIHRTASEINLILNQKHAALRERVMFQRIVSGMANRQRDGEITISVNTGSATPKPNGTCTIRSEKGGARSSSESQPTPLSVADDSSQHLLDSITPKKQERTQVGVPEGDDYFVGSFDKYKDGAAQPSCSTSPVLMKPMKGVCTCSNNDSEEIFPLDM